MVVVAVAEANERRDAEIANSTPILPIGKRNVERVLLIVTPAPGLRKKAPQRGPMRVVRVASRLLAGDGWLGGR
jgi:hypothetical protein